MSTIAAEVAEPFHENSARIVWRLAWPAVALNSLQTVNQLLDTAFIGHLPAAALTAQGGAINVLFLMFSLAMALGTGATALVARSYGAQDVLGYQMASRRATSLALLAGVVMAGVTLLITPLAAHAILPARDPEAIRLMINFLLMYCIGLPAIYLIQTLAGSLRAIGDTKSPMAISGIQILLHIALNFLFIFPPRSIGGIDVPGLGLGLPGASLALSVSAWASAIGYLAFTGRTPLGPLWHFRLPEREWIRRILRISVPAATMAVLRVASLTAFTLILATTPTGSSAIAAMRTAFSIEPIMFMPAFGLSVSAATLVGQSLGMKRPDRAERLGWVCAHHGALITITVSIPIFLFAPAIAGALVDHKEAITGPAIVLIRYLAASEFLFAYAMVLIGAMQGAGETVGPMWITIISMWGLRTPAAWLLAIPAGLGSTGAWIAMAASQAIQGLMALYAFRLGKWKSKQV